MRYILTKGTGFLWNYPLIPILSVLQTRKLIWRQNRSCFSCLAELENFSKEKMSEMSESDKRKFFANYMLYISRDATKWAPVSDIKAIKKVFGSKGGTISFGVGISEKEGIRSYLDVKEVK